VLSLDWLFLQQHVLRYVAIGVGIAAAAGIGGYLAYRNKKTKKAVKSK
jgi:hypothetical protein